MYVYIYRERERERETAFSVPACTIPASIASAGINAGLMSRTILCAAFCRYTTDAVQCGYAARNKLGCVGEYAIDGGFWQDSKQSSR